jgi:hypothetical protein
VQTTSPFPFRWCGMEPTVSGISQLDEPPRPHNTRTEAPNAFEPRPANPQGYADPTPSTSIRTGVNNLMTRFARVPVTRAVAASSLTLAAFNRDAPLGHT